MRIISIEGNIGCGKSTFLDTLSMLLNDNEILAKRVCIVTEPYIWGHTLDKTGASPLNMYYGNISKYAYTFQTYVTTSKYQYILHCLEDHEETWGRMPDILIVERYSSFADRKVFVQNLYNNGIIDDFQLEMYNFNCEVLRDMFENNITFDIKDIEFIYIQTNIETCMNRVLSRHQAGDDKITLELLTNIHVLHLNWLSYGAHGIKRERYDDVLDQKHIIHYYDNPSCWDTSLIIDFLVNKLEL